jgi:O-methyltransferase
MKKAASFTKSFILFLRPGLWANFFTYPLEWASLAIRLSRWISKHPAKGLNDFYSPLRDYGKRYQLYQHLLETENLINEPIDYVELGVSGAHSFRWWVANNRHPDSIFCGFDTFEGLPEKWGRFEKGSMSATVPTLEGNRHQFIKGLFQDTLPDFLKSGGLNNPKRKIIHLDADLFSSTLFALTSLHPVLKPNDILIFDEFNVPNHEFKAFMDYVDSYYVKYEVLAAVNNYFQVAIRLR